MKRYPEHKLLIGFGCLLVLTLITGLTSVFQISALSRTINEIGRRYTIQERLILRMKMYTAEYGTSLRNQVAWRIAGNRSGNGSALERTLDDLRHFLNLYSYLAESGQSRQWAQELTASVNEMAESGDRLLSVAAEAGDDTPVLSELSRLFDDKYYAVDDLLINTLGRGNFDVIEAKVEEARKKRDWSFMLLAVTVAGSLMLGAGIAAIVYRSLLRERLRRERLVREMIRVEERERANLSRQVHDQLGQDLGALKIYLELIGRSTQTERAGLVEQGGAILQRLIERGHNITELLRPPELDDMGLVASLESLIASCRNYAGVEISFYRPDGPLEMLPEHSLALYRVTQEILTNIVKHAAASQVTVSLQKSGELIRLLIRDDGRGIEPGDYKRSSRPVLGLQGLRERIELLGGTFRIDSRKGAGTTVTVELGTG